MRHASVSLLLALAGCFTGGSSPTIEDVPADFEVPNDPTFRAVREAAPAGMNDMETNRTYTIDVADCRYEILEKSHGLGSGYVLTRPIGGLCELWFGGETENPGYDGTPLQYCLLPRSGTVEFQPSSPTIDEATCVSLVAPVPDRAAFDVAITAPVVEHGGNDVIAIEIDTCDPARHTIGDASVSIHSIQQPSGARACELFLEKRGEPGRYCAFQRGAGQGTITPTFVGGEFHVDDDACFQPAY